MLSGVGCNLRTTGVGRATARTMALQVRGIQYDVGITTVEGGNSRPDLSAERVGSELDLISRELHANAVRVTGGDPERLAMASRLAVERGLVTWLTPQLVNGTVADTLALVGKCADLARELRQAGGSAVLVIGCELSGFMAGVIPGRCRWGRNRLRRGRLLCVRCTAGPLTTALD